MRPAIRTLVSLSCAVGVVTCVAQTSEQNYRTKAHDLFLAGNIVASALWEGPMPFGEEP
jgi:hypothetical protein